MTLVSEDVLIITIPLIHHRIAIHRIDTKYEGSVEEENTLVGCHYTLLVAVPQCLEDKTSHLADHCEHVSWGNCNFISFNMIYHPFRF